MNIDELLRLPVDDQYDMAKQLAANCGYQLIDERINVKGSDKVTKFIRLQEANGRKCQLLLNVDHIAAIQNGEGSKDTYIRMRYNTYTSEGKIKSEYYFVNESLEQIAEMIK